MCMHVWHCKISKTIIICVGSRVVVTMPFSTLPFIMYVQICHMTIGF